MSFYAFINTVREFLELEIGILISDPNYKIKLGNINEKEVYIKRKAIKHFTESRIKELYKFSKEKQLELIMSISEDLEKVLLKPDLIYKNIKRENSFIYIKKIDEYKTPRSVVIEHIQSHIEIVSVHLVKEKDYQKQISYFKK